MCRAALFDHLPPTASDTDCCRFQWDGKADLIVNDAMKSGSSVSRFRRESHRARGVNMCPVHATNNVNFSLPCLEPGPAILSLKVEPSEIFIANRHAYPGQARSREKCR